MKSAGCLILETGEIFKGLLLDGSSARAGELVFNTSCTGYEEIATDPSYYHQILTMTSPHQGNYGVDKAFQESGKLMIQGFVCLEMQNSQRDSHWLKRLISSQIPVLSHIDTRALTLRIRDKGTVWAAIVPLSDRARALSLIKKLKAGEKDWSQAVSVKKPQEYKGEKTKGHRIALVDFGFKKNILRELLKRSERVCVFPSSKPEGFLDIRDWEPSALVLSNGPGDPNEVKGGIALVQKLLGFKPLLGICMGHQILALAVGAKTYKLKFGHRGSNHPIKDKLLNRIYISSQNHGYAVQANSLPEGVELSHINLNDGTVAGIFSKKWDFMGVQFHPENRPGPKESEQLFDFFLKHFTKKPL